MPVPLLLALSTLVLSACHAPSTTVYDNPLRRTRWELRQLGTTEVRRNFASRRQPYLLLHADTTAEGLGGGNSFSGKARLNNLQVSFRMQLNAHMPCDDSPTETAFIQTLNTTHYYRISGPMLLLYAGVQPTSLPLAQLEAAPARRESALN